jgi:hypothetical protein
VYTDVPNPPFKPPPIKLPISLIKAQRNNKTKKVVLNLKQGKIPAENVFDWGDRTENFTNSNPCSSQQLCQKTMPSHSFRDMMTSSGKMDNLRFRTARSGWQEVSNFLTSRCVQTQSIFFLGVERNLYREQSAALKCNIAASPKGKY